MKIYIKLGLFLLMEFLIVVVCVLFGGYLNSEAQKNQTLTIEKIALVNLDEGTEVDHSIKNYGVEFVGSLGSGYEVTGLEQARKGLENGLYAAYIIIPAAFSKNIESINSEPVKSNIVYKINRNLEAASREKVIADITSFNSSLSTNIEYVFLDALLREVHMVQDKSGGILENDRADLKKILEFAQSELVVDPDYPEEKSVDRTITALDLSNEYSTVQSIFAKLSSSYRQDGQKVQEALDRIIRVSEKTDKEMKAMDTELQAIYDGRQEGNQYIENAEEYQKFVSSYNRELLSWEETNRTLVEDNFKQYLSACDQSVREQVNHLLDKHKEHLTSYYGNAFTELGENKVTFNFDQKEAENYLDIMELSSYQYVKRISAENVTYKKEYQDLSRNIKSLGEKVQKTPYFYEVEVDGQKRRETGYLMTAADINQLMKWITDLKETSPIMEPDVLESQFVSCQKKDISVIGRKAEHQKNADFIKLQKESFYGDLVYYGAGSREDIEKYVEEAQYKEFDQDTVKGVIDHFYNPAVKLVVRGTVQQENGPAEDETLTEPEEPGTGDEEQEDEEGLILFKGTGEVPALDEKQLSNNIADEILKPLQSRLIAGYDSMKNEWNSLSSDLSQFEIEDYSDNDIKRELEDSFYANVSNIEKAVGEKEREYTDYAAKVEKAGEDNLAAWKENIKKANETTHSNIDKNLSVIKENREKLNEDNNILLTDITKALPYSRLGELEHKKVYSFIVDPVEYQDISEDKKATAEERSKEEDNSRPLFAGMALAVLLFGSFLIFRMAAGKHDSNIRENNPDLL